MSQKMNVGGQAIIEGVMMRSPRSFAIAVRRANGQIVVTERAWESLNERFPFLKWPIFRGAVMMVESLFNGIQALMFSADQAMEGLEDGSKGGKNETQAMPLPELSEGQNKLEVADTSSRMSTFAIAMTIIGSLGFAFLVFKGIPHLVATLLGTNLDFSANDPLFHIIDGVVKLALFVAYLAGISFLPDIKRVFQYHGAEHKSIHVYEAGLPLTVENARPFTTLHPRCGTSFILIVLLASILIFMAVFPLIGQLHPNTWINALILIAIKLPLMLPVAGLSYEFLKFSGKHPRMPLVRWLILPGLWMQKITTREPDDSQLEIALVALRKTLWRENTAQEVLHVEDERRIELYRSYSEITF